jgi:hypothetical protein
MGDTPKSPLHHLHPTTSATCVRSVEKVHSDRLAWIGRSPSPGVREIHQRRDHQVHYPLVGIPRTFAAMRGASMPHTSSSS